MKKYAIIVAGGKGERMGSNIPKQFLLIKDKPMLYYTMKVFAKEDNSTEIIVVLPPDYIDKWLEYMQSLPTNEQIKFKAVCGGQSRIHSVYNGFKLIDQANALVAIHDGARPCLSIEMLQRGWMCAAKNGSAIPTVPITDSLRIINKEGGSNSVNRNLYRAVQTPQIFTVKLLNSSYQQCEINNDRLERDCSIHNQFTDDASVVEAAGYDITLYDGDQDNIKATTQKDIVYLNTIFDS